MPLPANHLSELWTLVEVVPATQRAALHKLDPRLPDPPPPQPLPPPLPCQPVSTSSARLSSVNLLVDQCQSILTLLALVIIFTMAIAHLHNGRPCSHCSHEHQQHARANEFALHPLRAHAAPSTSVHGTLYEPPSTSVHGTL